jgi:hypothetical protein
MRENRPYGLEGGESGSTGLPYPYRFGSGRFDSSAVATCRQTVEALLAPLSTAWQRMSTIRQRTIRFLGRSHLSPDGGSVTRAAVHRLAADGYDSAADDSIPRP